MDEDDQTGRIEKPKFPVKDLIKAGPGAPKVLVDHVVNTQGRDIAAKVEAQRSRPDFDLDSYVENVIKSHLMLARGQGAGGGAVIAVAALPALAGGPGTAIAAATTAILGDLVALAWIQLRLVLHIAAAHGHDVTDPNRANEILALAGIDLVAGQGGAPVVAAAGQRVGKRLLERYLKGSALQAIKGMFRLVGIKFSRAALVRGLPIINIPAGAVVSDVTTRRVARKADKFYRTFPAS